MKRFLILAMIVSIVAIVGVSAIAGPVAYVINTCTSGATQNSLYTGTYARTSTNCTVPPLAGWTANGTTTGHFNELVGTTSTDRTTLSSSGVGYWFERTVESWGQWNFTVPAGKSGYYKVYAAWPNGGTWMPAQQPQVWKVVSEGTPTTDVTISQLETTATANVWQPITAGEVQMNEGGTYSLRCTTPILAADDNTKRVYFASAAFVYQRSNAPAGLTATPRLDGTAVDLAWTAPTPAPVSYDIERSDDGGATFTQIATGITDLLYADTTGACDVTSQYRVKAVDAGGIISGPSNVVAALKCASVPPTAASNPTPAAEATLIHTDFTPLSWTPGNGSTSQAIYFGTSSTFTTPVATVGPMVTTYAQGALTANTDYYWRIDEINSAGTTTGEVWHFKTGVSVTIEAIRGRSRGTITYPVAPDPMSNWGDKGWFNAGDNLSFTAAETAPFSWVGWSTDPTGATIFDTNRSLEDPTNPFVVPTTNTTLYAVFSGTHYTVTTVASPVAGGSIVATDQTWPSASLSEVEEGEVIHLVATVNPGYVFAGWESNQPGTFANPLAATTNYTMTGADTQITAYFATASATLAATGTRCISAQDLAGTGSDWWTTQTNIAAYSPTNNQLFARDLVQFTDWAGFQTIPAMSMRQGLGRITAIHTVASSYSGSVTIKVSAFPVLTPWVYSTVDAGATWTTTDGTALWTTPGGDMGAELGTATDWVGVPAADTNKYYYLPTGVDYRALLVNGLEFMAPPIAGVGQEGDIAKRKGFGKTSSLLFYYNTPTGADVIKTWAYIGSWTQGASGDHQLRIDTDAVSGTYNGVPVGDDLYDAVETPAVVNGHCYLAPKVGASLGTKTWAVGTSLLDAVDFLSAEFFNTTAIDNATVYAATYVYNPGAGVWPCYLATGADDYARVYVNDIIRGTKAVAEGVRADAQMVGPFTLVTGWNRVVVKVENGAVGFGLQARLANADRTPVAGLTFATTDTQAPTAPTATCAGVTSGVAQSTVDTPVFTFAGASDTLAAGEGVSGVRGYKVYFGTDPAGVPATWVEAYPVGGGSSNTFEPGLQTVGTYYLRVQAVDYALNESAVADVFTFILGTPGPPPPPEGTTAMTTIQSLWPITPDGTTMYNFSGVNAKRVAAVMADGSFSIEETNRTAGIMIIPTGDAVKYFDGAGKTAIAAGDLVDVYGTMPVLAAGSAKTMSVSYIRDWTSVGAGEPIPALGATQRYVVGTKAPGTAAGQTPGLPTGKGLYNAGLFVKIAGAVVATAAPDIFVEDKTFFNGTNYNGGIKVIASGLTLPTTGTVTVTGVVGMVGNVPVIYAASCTPVVP